VRPVSAPVPLPSLGAVVRLGLYYGVAGFGGGFSVLAQLRRDLVERRAWLTADEFLVAAELSKSLPGTPSTNLFVLLGQRFAGARGGILAAVAFLLPSAVLMVVCGATYSLLRAAPWLATFFDGMNAAMVGVVAWVTLDLGRGALRSKRDVALAIACAVLLATRLVSEPILAGAAVLVGAARGGWSARPPGAASLAAPLVLAGSLGALAGLVRVFVPIGVTTFGGGLAMIPAIEHMVVLEQGWLDAKGFADAMALGQITPGPVAICATFIGYRVAGLAGALVATVAMFGPAMAITLTAGASVERFRTSPVIGGILRTLAPVVIGMLAAATFSLGRAAVAVHVDVALAVAAFALLVARPVSPFWLLFGGGVVRLGLVYLQTP
jgi:chromate transporter